MAEKLNAEVTIAPSLIEKAAVRLFEEQDRLDPGPAEAWDELSERDKAFYRFSTESLLISLITEKVFSDFRLLLRF